MASPAYVIGKGEMLLITASWIDGDTYIQELKLRSFTHDEVQEEIDQIVGIGCVIKCVDRYDMARRVGEDISEDFDIRSQEERDEDAAEIESTPYRDPNAEHRTHNCAQTGVAGGYGR